MIITKKETIMEDHMKDFDPRSIGFGAPLPEQTPENLASWRKSTRHRTPSPEQYDAINEELGFDLTTRKQLLEKFRQNHND
jgi:hypothetical protein